jgi:dTDP-4-dehydrorhamnose 3,5-epimerase
METTIRLKNNIFFDHRGSFSPLSLKVLDKDWVQSNISFNLKKWTLRGLHYQRGEFEQSKLIKVINGKILDFVFDMRIENNSEIEFFEMISGDEVYIPKGYAHGFITLEDNTIVQYLVDNEYNQPSEGNIIWDKFTQIEDKIKTIEPNFDKGLITISDKDLIENGTDL